MNRKLAYVFERMNRAFSLLRNQGFFIVGAVEENNFEKAKEIVQARARKLNRDYVIFWQKKEQLRFENENGLGGLSLSCLTTDDYFMNSDETKVARLVNGAFQRFGVEYEWSGRLIHRIVIKDF